VNIALSKSTEMDFQCFFIALSNPTIYFFIRDVLVIWFYKIYTDTYVGTSTIQYVLLCYHNHVKCT
jgi:hypothetical protein